MQSPSYLRRLSLLAPLALLACSRSAAPQFNGVDLTGAAYARDFELSDVNEQPRRLADFRGRVLVVFFGFTQCPDVCPTTMGELRAVKEALGPAGDDVTPIFISVDPERDTPQLLRDYTAAFGPDFVALRGTLEQTEAVAKEFKAYFKKVPAKEGDGYSVDHSAACYLFDRKGRVRVYSRYGAGTQQLLEDIKQLLAEAA